MRSCGNSCRSRSLGISKVESDNEDEKVNDVDIQRHLISLRKGQSLTIT